MREGRLIRPMAIMTPGMFLSHPGMEMLASYHWPPITVWTHHQQSPPAGMPTDLDRIGNQVARLQRIAHAAGAHRDAVTRSTAGDKRGVRNRVRGGGERRRSSVGPVPDTDGVELHADQAGLLDAQADLVVEVHQVHITRVSRIPHLAKPVSNTGVVGERSSLAAPMRFQPAPCSCPFRPIPSHTLLSHSRHQLGKKEEKKGEGKNSQHIACDAPCDLG